MPGSKISTIYILDNGNITTTNTQGTTPAAAVMSGFFANTY
jgi:hypothetical protein